MADIRKLLETAQEVLSQPSREFPKPFWEVLAKRCIQSMHLLKPMELAIISRTFDVHNVELKPRYDVYHPIAEQARCSKHFPGLAVLVLAEVLPRKLDAEKADLNGLLKMLGRQAADVMWELSVSHAVRVLEALTVAGIRDAPLCSRVARKLAAQLEVRGAVRLEDLAAAASAFAGQDHRDLPLLLSIADATAVLCEEALSSDDAAKASRRVLDALEQLGVDDVLQHLRGVAARAAEAAIAAAAMGRGERLQAAEETSTDASASFSLEDLPSGGSRPGATR